MSEQRPISAGTGQSGNSSAGSAGAAAAGVTGTVTALEKKALFSAYIRSLVDEIGAGILSEPARFRAFLMDRFPRDRREIRALYLVAEERGALALYQASEAGLEIEKKRQLDQLGKTELAPELATWAVEVLALAFRRSSPVSSTRAQDPSVAPSETLAEEASAPASAPDDEVPIDISYSAGVTVSMGAAPDLPAGTTDATIDQTKAPDTQALVDKRVMAGRCATTPVSDRGASDVVETSVFAPFAGHARAGVLVQVLLHRPDQGSQADALALAADPQAERRGITTLTTEVDIGQRIDVVLEGDAGLEIKEPNQFLVWRGEARACQFLVTLPADAAGRNYRLRVRILVESVPVGVLQFTLHGIAESDAAERDAQIRGEWARRYRQAFLSYASDDRAEVLKRAQGLKAARIGFFQDVLTLEPGERWERRLFEEIDRCDLFLLFWSSKAAQSSWVIREAEYALARREKSSNEVPDITPVLLEGPPIPPLPSSLSQIHFNDPIRYVIAATPASDQRQDETPPPAPTPSVAKSRLVWGGAGLVALVVLAIVVFNLQPSPSSVPQPPTPWPPRQSEAPALRVPNGTYRGERGWSNVAPGTPYGTCENQYPEFNVSVMNGSISFTSDYRLWNGTIDQRTGYVNISEPSQGLSIAGVAYYESATMTGGTKCISGYFRFTR
jgi:hypothetical protein